MNNKNDKIVENKRYLSTIELGEYIGKSKWWIYDKIKKREIPFIPIGREARFDIYRIDAWMAKKEVRAV